MLRGLILVLALAMSAQPAFAHHRPNHPSHPASLEGAHASPCAISFNPHRDFAARVMSRRCERLVAQVRAAPDDADVLARCDSAAWALTGRSCSAAI